MKELVAAFEHLAQALERNVDEFTHLDSEAGDGDLGLTAGKIAGGIRKALEEPGDSVKALVLAVGKEVSKAAPSTFGTLYASGFLAAGMTLDEGDDALSQFHKGLQAAFDKIALRGKSEEGQRTLLDALGPAARAALAASSMPEALEQAAIAAEAGVLATKEMAPVHGRAGWIGDRAKGLPDAGATVIWRSLEAFSTTSV
ncbi:MAG: DAK2 domain-containing protein [Pontimonas sp.]|jgi:phosphoenolpyruvate---glycerone phosphotransferase subunit DhaL